MFTKNFVNKNWHNSSSWVPPYSCFPGWFPSTGNFQNESETLKIKRTIKLKREKAPTIASISATLHEHYKIVHHSKPLCKKTSLALVNSSSRNLPFQSAGTLSFVTVAPQSLEVENTTLQNIRSNAIEVFRLPVFIKLIGMILILFVWLTTNGKSTAIPGILWVLKKLSK